MNGEGSTPRFGAGHDGPGGQQVYDDQAARIHAAMLQVVCELGYSPTVVKDVVRAAGMSSRTFYEHFPNKPACFLAVTERKLGEWRRGCAAAFAAAGGLQAGDRTMALRAALVALFEQVRVDPRGAQILFVEALAAGPESRRRVADVMDELCDLARRFVQGPDGETHVPDIVILCLAGGVVELVANRCLDGRADELLDLVEPLARWFESYRFAGASDVVQRACAHLLEAERTLPGPPARILSQQATLGSATGRNPDDPRARIINAIPQAAEERGDTELSVNEIVRCARVSQHTFRDHFGTAEEALTATMLAAGEDGLAYCMPDMAATDGWESSIVVGLITLTRYLCSRPAVGRFAFYYAVSGSGRKVRNMELDLWGAALWPGFRLPHPPHRIVAEAIGGGIYRAFLQCYVRDDIERIESYGPAYAYVALAPFLGAQQAAAAIQNYLRSP